jgi:hypothetical protein
MKAGIKPIIAGGVLFFLGAFVPMAIFLPIMINGDPSEVIFKVPGVARVSVDKPGRYYLWNAHQIVFEGKSYNCTESIPAGMEIIISNEDTGQTFDLVSHSSMTSTRGTELKNSIGYFDVKSAGSLSIKITGGNEQRVFAFSKSPFVYIKMFVGVMVLAAIIGLSGFGFILCGVVKLIKSNSTAKKAYV